MQITPTFRKEPAPARRIIIIMWLYPYYYWERVHMLKRHSFLVETILFLPTIGKILLLFLIVCAHDHLLRPFYILLNILFKLIVGDRNRPIGSEIRWE